jgi:capsular polysaccharide transport system permease protein
VIASIYFLLVATPRFVSEANFVVRSSSQSTPSSLGVALQGVGLSNASTEAFVVHEYMTSSRGTADLRRRFDLPAMLGGPRVDALSRFPQIGESDSAEGLRKTLRRFVSVGYDSTTGISTVRVQAFSPRDAQALASALLDGGEQVVNQMNARAAADSVADARAAQAQARARLAEAQRATTEFRNAQQLIDPGSSAAISAELITRLLANVAELRAEREQIAAGAPDSPQLPVLDRRIASFEQQLSAERAKLAGRSSSLAPLVGQYEELTLRSELAAEELTQATAALITAEQEAQRQKLYVERIVPPNLPERASEPRRLRAILTIFGTALLLYGLGWLVWAGVREHTQE